MRRSLPVARAFLFFWSCVCVSPAASSAQQPSEHSWSVEYVGGTESIELEAQTQIVVAEEALRVEGPSGQAFSIPLEEVSDIIHEKKPNWAKRARDQLLEGVAGSGGAGNLGGALVAVGAVLLSLGPFSGDHRFVTVLWEDGGERMAVFKVEKEGSQGFLSALERATGQPVRDPEQEYKEAYKHRVRLKLEREVWLSGRRMKPKTYKVALLPQNRGRWLLLWSPSRRPALWSSSVRVSPPGAKQILFAEVVTPVEVEPGAGGRKEARVEYAPSSPTLAAIHLSDRLLRPKGPHLFPPAWANADGGRISIEYPDGEWRGIVNYEEYEGDPALKFPARHFHGGSSDTICEGFVYVTPSRVGYVTSLRGHSFAAPRAEIQEAKFTKIKSKAGTYRFAPLFTKEGKSAVRHGFGRPFDDLFVAAFKHFDALEADLRRIREPQPK